jgi:succinate-acetate transporter protein
MQQVCQYISGIMEFISGNTFGATVFSSYGAFNVSSIHLTRSLWHILIWLVYLIRLNYTDLLRHDLSSW